VMIMRPTVVVKLNELPSISYSRFYPSKVNRLRMIKSWD
ncbi:hypothetical protein V3C99_000736, partial [Haemonchus contortus]